MPDHHFDAVILGCGSAGTTAAKRLRAAGRSVAVVERDKLGGDCPNRACVPTKALLRSAHVYALLRRSGELGLKTGEVGFDWAAVMKRKDDIVASTGGQKAADDFARRGVALFRGDAAFVDEHHVRVGDTVLRGERFLIATGGRPAKPDIPGLDEARPITSEQAVSLPALPESLIVVGGGAVGCEFAHLFTTFGVKVTLLHKHDELLPREEPELARLVRKALEESGATVVAGVEVERFVGKIVRTTRGEFRAAEILLATGREASVAELNLAAAGVAVEHGRVRIDNCLRTSRPHIFAAGDVCGPMLYTHFAHYQGRVAADNLFAATPTSADYRVIPRVTFTEPPVASVGQTEAEAKKGRAVRCATFEVEQLGKALVESEGGGLVKLVADAATGELLGAHVAGPAAGEVIHEAAAAMAGRLSVRQLAETVHAFPNYAEGLKAAAKAWVGP